MNLSRVFIHVRRPDEPGNAHEWEVCIHPGKRVEPAIALRRIRRVVYDGIAYPQPLEYEAQALPLDAPHRLLCTTSDPSEIELIYHNITIRQPNRLKNDVEVFGRYLSATLLGPEGWQAINAYAPSQLIELALCFDPSAKDLARLPWEMMYGSSNFLIAEPQRLVAITRIVADCPHTANPLSSPLKVLFVVGSDLSDDRIRPGAEYLGLLRRLEAERILNFQSRILLAASILDLEDEIKRWQPSVVHFICHGDARGFLELTTEDERERQPRQQFSAQALLPILQAGGLRPLVVLNACYSGAAAQEAVPLAAELVQGGIPIVVAMAGRVADRACRFFTRRFYEALLQQESLVAATAEGRRAGFVQPGNPQASIDWIFPTVFLAEQVSPQVSITQNPQSNWDQLRDIADRYHILKEPPVFCDRITFIEAFQRLLSEKAPYTVLAVEARAAAFAQDSKPQYGKTRLLQELAARAVRDGHIPCLLSLPKDEKPPATPMDLAQSFIEAILTTYERFQFPQINMDNLVFECDQLNALLNDPTITVPLKPFTQQMLLRRKSPGDWKVVAAALRADFLTLAAVACHNNPHALVLVLVDDVHRFGIAPPGNSTLDLFLKNLLTLDGLMQPGDPFRIAFTYSNPAAPEHEATLKMLSEAIPQMREYVKALPLEAFKGLNEYGQNDYRHDEYHLAYQQFLLYRNLIIGYSVTPQDINKLYRDLHNIIRGNPSRFLPPNEALEVLIYAYTDLKPLLENANDEDLLRLTREGLGIAGAPLAGGHPLSSPSLPPFPPR